MREQDLIITRKKTPAWYVSWGLLLLSLLAGSYYLGQSLAVNDRQQLVAQTLWLEKKLDEYQQAYQQANQDLVMQTQSAKVDDQSNQQLVETVKRLQSTQLQLEAELKFYRKIMAPELEQSGLTIASLTFNQPKENQAVQYKLVLTQAGRQEQFLKGQVELEVHGVEGGQSKVYRFNELGAFKSADFEFQFRYFQNLEGEIILPEGFIAQEVAVVAKTRGLRKNQSAEKQFKWNI